MTSPSLLPVGFLVLSVPFTARAEIFTLPDITRKANADQVEEHFDFIPNDGWSGNPPDVVKEEESLYFKFTVSWAPAAKIGSFRVGLNFGDDGLQGRLAAQTELNGFSLWTNNNKFDPDGPGPATAPPSIDAVNTKETTSVTFVLKIDQVEGNPKNTRPDTWFGDINRQEEACAFLYINPNLSQPEAGQTTKWATWRSGNHECQGVMFRTDTADVDLHFSNIALYTGDDTPFGGGGGPTASPAPAISPDYTAWRSARYPRIGEPDADDDGDGHNNAFEHLFGLNPTDSKSSNPYAGPFDARINIFRYFRRSAKLTGLNFIIEYSTDGKDWREDKAAQQKTVSEANDVETVAVRIDPALLKEANVFVRVTAVPLDGKPPGR